MKRDSWRNVIDIVQGGRPDGSRWSESLSIRLLITCTVALIVTVTLVSLAVVTLLESNPTSFLGRHRQNDMGTRLIDTLRYDAQGNPQSVTLIDEIHIWRAAFPDQFQYRVLDPKGTVLLSSEHVSSDFPSADDYFDPQAERFAVESDGLGFHVETLPFTYDGKQFFLQTAVSDQLSEVIVRNRLKPVFTTAKIIAGISLCVFILAIYFTFHSMFRPLRRVSDAAAKISPENLTSRLSLDGIPSEVRPLAEAFNSALDRLEEGFRVQQSFFASAAHELKTPLTLIRGQIELQGDSSQQARLLQDVDLMSRQVQQLLHIAEVSELYNYRSASTDVVAVVDEVIRYLERRAEKKRVRIVVAQDAPVSPLEADKAALFILLKNLVENAVEVSPESAVVTIDISNHSVAVNDQGEGIDPSDLPHIFSKFWRAPGNKYEGAGLGLAICRKIANTYGWQLFVDRSVAHTRFVVLFDDRVADT
ncbi:sensor histidine kinase [Halotalea alkalilenta]|uniref:sensor histidine kinase n=1 Tax=Halotalea alkalilenta TaxID=376489 RepID=UPI00069441AE|nr:ATP-binding protein [Halotalea alkalilenta]